ncbi:hypothetical protein GYH30_049434 [Glycine max]|nr:hypothetical protein GYH30_049434 [Glycine max]
MEDVIDEYNISCEDKQPDDPRCAALLCEAVAFIKTQILLFQSAYKIQDVKSLARAERDGFQSHFPLEQRPTSCRGNQDVTWQKLRRDPLFIEEDEVVELDNDRATLKYWLTNGREKRTVISVVGIAGVGKTTLAKQVYDQVRNNFECHALITVSQSYSVEGLLRSCFLYFGMYPEDYEVQYLSGLYIDWPDQSVSRKDEKLSQDLVNKFPTNYMVLKVLDFEGSGLRYVPENLGNLCHLKYLSFRYTWIESLPKSVGKLQNLETLDIRDTYVFEIPEEIMKLKKLRHLLSNYISSIQWKDIGGMASLQEIPPVIIDDDGVVIGEVGKLKQLRELTVRDFEGKHKETLCSLINEMPLLEKLLIDAADWYEEIDLYITSPMSTLRKLVLWGTSTRLTNDALKSLKNMPRLLFLILRDNAYEGETLHFQCGGFQKLKQLNLGSLDQLKCILIDRGALCSVEEIVLEGLSQLKTVPSGIQHLEKLKDLYINCMPTEFEQRIAPDGGEDHWIIQDVPRVCIWSRDALEPSHLFGRSHH